MAIEHPPPTPATVKLLYAHAFACAYPDCTRPLYREDEVTGTWTLNSRICHINARSEGGPRWEPAQSADDNRGGYNLLLMCPSHASAIDDPQALAAYPATLLRDWKKAQIENYRRRMEGWPLTRTMAEHAITASFSNVGIAINQSTVQLGGEGGKAPGAGGGGGGAIGHNARAGRGGDGGKHYNFDGEPSSPSTLERVLSQLGLSSDQMPGVGGGGAGAIGENAVAGNGGNGGDSASGVIDAVPGDILEFEVGEGGKRATLPGQHGQDGGDTVIRVRSRDGTLKRTIRAKGGQGATTGDLPDQTVEISQTDLSGGFCISMLLLANAAELRDGLLFVLGGGWSSCNVPELPCNVIWPVACTAAWSTLNLSLARGLQLCVVDPQGSEVSRIALELPTQAASGTNFHWLANIGATLNSEGRWAVRIQSGEFLLSQTEIRVTLAR